MQILIYPAAFILIALWRMHFTVLRKSDHQYLRLNGFKAFNLWLINNHICLHFAHWYGTRWTQPFKNVRVPNVKSCKRCGKVYTHAAEGWLAVNHKAGYNG